MEKVKLSRIVEKLESGSREKGGSLQSGVISIGGTHLSNNAGFKWDKEEFISEDFYLKMRSGKVQFQDILIVKDGATTGKTSFVDETFPYENAAINEHVFRLQINQDQANPKYVFYFLHSPTGQEQILNDFRGATVGGISRGFIDKVEIPLPNLESQNKIVAILDKAKTILDKREKTIQQYGELLKSIFVGMFGDPVQNEKGWETITLGELGLWKSGGTPSRSNRSFFTGDVPWVTSGELNELYISTTKENISQEAINASNAKLIPSNSLLIGMYDTAALKSSINTIPLACNQAIAYSKIDEQKCNILYVHTAIQIGKEFFKSNQRGVRQQNLNLTMIKEISIPKPNIDLQHEFVIKYKKLLNLYSKIHVASENGQTLLGSLSQQVFSERLTINIETELESLLNIIDLDKSDNENKIDTVKSDMTFLQRLIDKLQEQDFENSNQYEKAKYLVFRIMKEESNLIKQHFSNRDKKVKLVL